MNITNEDSARILAALQAGFRTDCAHLEELERDLAETLLSASHFGLRHGVPDEWNVLWQQHWDNIAAILRRIRVLVREMELCTRSDAGDLLDLALTAWSKIQIEDALLVEALGAVRTQATALDAAVRKDWNGVAQSLGPQVARLHTCARVLRIRVELLRSHSAEGVESIVQQLLSKLPGSSPGDPAQEANLKMATGERPDDRHAAGGIMDVVRGLLMWVETPGERPGTRPEADATAIAPLLVTS